MDIVIAHYGLDRKVTREECTAALPDQVAEKIFIDFEASQARLNELFDLPFENIALAQQRKFTEVLKPVLDQNPNAHIHYFGLAPIPVAFHFGYLVGNTRGYTIYQWHHKQNKWFSSTAAPTEGYEFKVMPIAHPLEKQKGKGNVIIRIGTSFSIDQQSTHDLVSHPENEFDIELASPHFDSLFNQENILQVVEAFQEVLNSYSNKLTDREQIHLFISSSVGLPFALGTRINTNIYPYVQTYQYDRVQTPKYREAILITKEVNDRVVLSEDDRKVASIVRQQWEEQLQSKLKPFIKMITGTKTDNWLQTVCETTDEYNLVRKHLKSPWNSVTNIGETSLKDDKIDLLTVNVDEGFEYTEKTNTWQLDDGFLSGLKKRLDKDGNTDVMQAGRLFFFHEALHYSKSGHRLTKEIATGIGQFPKVIEEADYQADVWGLLTEYKYCCMYEPSKLHNGLKEFFCNAIDTAVETMWSFIDTGKQLNSVQIRSMNRFLNWYWQWVLVEDLSDKGSLEDVISILFDKPVIEFAGAPMELRAHRTFYKLNNRQLNRIELASFVNNKVRRFAPTEMEEIVSGFRQLKGDKIKTALKSFQVNI
jgi:hypothetical protein